MSKKPGVAGHALSLPTGGGALKGIGETFHANLCSGTGTHTIPIAISPGRNGFGPSLSLQYSAANGNGLFGLGWDLTIPRITRKTEKGLPRYDSDDIFVMSGAEDLVRCLQKISDPATGETTWIQQEPLALPRHTVFRYRPRTEGIFSRIEQWVDNTTGDVHWRATTSDNITSIYGGTTASRLVDPSDEGRVHEWLLQETFDGTGNHIRYEYARDDPRLYGEGGSGAALTELFEANRTATQLYIRRIYYGNLREPLTDEEGEPVTYPDGTPVGHLRGGRRYAFEVVFDYGDWELPTRPVHPEPPPEEELELFGPDPLASSDHNPVPVREDRFSSFRAGFEVRTIRRCRRVLMFHHFAECRGPILVRSTAFSYSIDPDTRISLLSAVTVSGYRKDSAGGYAAAEMPPVAFTYTGFRPHEQLYQAITAPGGELPSVALDNPNLALVDLLGDGLPAVVESSRSGVRYWRNLGGGMLDRPRSLPQIPAAVAFDQPGVGFGDINGDGHTDLLVHAGPLPGFFETTIGAAWQTFKPYDLFPSFDLDDPRVRLIDLTGDGRPDALMTDAEHLLWFECLGEQGFGPAQFVARRHDPEQFPDVFFDDPAGRVRLADMTGDGLTDIVLVHDGRIEYWPNLGYGRFGKRVVMANAPRFTADFDPERLFLADVNGTGCADLVYAALDRVHFWFNRSGNSWSDRETIAGTPPAGSAAALQFADIFGSGTAALVWSCDFAAQPESHYKALDFCGGVKPYILTEVRNNLGVETRVRYGSSTRHFLEDRANGRPWVSNLPFPVQVVDRVEVVDRISRTRHVTTYKYHHGYFDGREREFRGFGRVDQFDAEDFEDFTRSSHDDDVAFKNGAFAYHAPPVETRSWFHTGIYFDEDSFHDDSSPFDFRELTQQFRREFYQEDAEAVSLPEHDVEAGETPHEAYRALRGALLRSEVYARDGSDKAGHPYQVVENRYRVVQVQPTSESRHGVYSSHQFESLTWQYERNPADPRVSHALTLEVDDFGNPLRTLAIAYGRRRPDTRLPGQADRERQAHTLITYTESRFTNAVDEPQIEPRGYRAPQSSEARTYELTGFTPSFGGQFSASEWMVDAFARLETCPEIPYEATADPSREQKRLIEHVRTRYRKDDLTALLGLGELESLALPGQSYSLAFTPSLLAQVYGDRVTDARMEEGGYVHFDDDANWWSPSGRVFYSAGVADTPGEELARARQHFFVPVRFADAFGNVALAAYDDYDLLLKATRDPLGSQSVADHDYRVLQPFRLTDPNGNRAEVAFDALGLVAGTAVMGKASEVVGDSFAGFVLELTSQQLQEFLADPLDQAVGLLGQATTRIVHDLHRHRLAGEPAFAAVLSRETHTTDPAPPGGVRIQVSISYSDGLGREIQKKVRAEPGPVVEGGPNVGQRWVGTGWTTFNNKGKPVKKHEPFFDDTAAFRFAREIGVSSTHLYDPTQRVIATLHPNHTWEKVVIEPWRQEQWDANDTALIATPENDADVGALFRRLPESDYRPSWFEARENGQLGDDEQDAAVKAALHAGTPNVAYFDPLGRTIATIAHNRVARDGAMAEEAYVSRAVVDVEGNNRENFDANARLVMRHAYDMLATPIHRSSMETGERWTLNDASGQAIYGWDSRGHEFHTTYDRGRRPTHAFVREGVGAERLIGQTVYGESLPNPEAGNLRGKVARLFDGAGVVVSESYDFKGNLLSSSRQLTADYESPPDWLADPALDPDVFTSRTSYDALNRPVTLTSAHTPGMQPSIVHASYNAANLLEAVDVHVRGAATTPVVKGIDYNANGQRVSIRYGNGVTTEYVYSPENLRLAQLISTRASDDARLQDWGYTYDPVGNISHIRDGAQQDVYFNNVVITPDNDYTYDAIYQLVEARGREHIGQLSRHETSWADEFRSARPHPQDGEAMRRYTDRYEYDAAGNIERVVHQAPNAGWTRTYAYSEASLIDPAERSNRLSGTTVGAGTPEIYPYDAHGNMRALPHLPQLDWDFKDRLRHVGLGGGGEAFYVYDAAGLRVRKVVERNGGSLIEERLYLGGFEIFRRRNAVGMVRLERESLHVMDDTQRIALIETKTVDTDHPAAAVQSVSRFQLSNHLGSACLELDDQGRLISYEEYYPYGSTSYQAVRTAREAPKRYRYIGKERDEETGFSYHGARYYALWLGRWVSADPIGLGRGMNAFAYCGDNPIGRTDADGADWSSFNPQNWCKPWSSECDVVLDDIAIGFAEAYGQFVEDNVGRVIDLSSMYNPVAMVGHATGWYDTSTCFSPECKKYDPNNSLGANIMGNVYDNTVGGAVQLAEGVAQGDPESLGALGFAVAISRGKGKGPSSGSSFKLPVPQLRFAPTLEGTVAVGVSVGELAMCRPALSSFGGPLLATSVTGSAFNNSSSQSSSGSSSSSSSTSPPVRVIAEGVGKEPTRVKPSTLTAKPRGGARSCWDEAALFDEGMTARSAFARSPLHHVIPQELLKNQKIARLLEKRNIDIDEFAVRLSEGEHTAIHVKGYYNLLWKRFFEHYPRASRASIVKFAEVMRKWAKIDPALPYERYQ